MKLARRCKTAPLAAALMLVFAGAAMADQPAASAASEQKAAGAQPVGEAPPAAAQQPATAGGEQPDQAGKAEQAQKAEAGLKVGFVLPTAPDASGWSRSHQNGIDTLRETLGDQVQVTVLENVKDVDAEKAFRELADAGNRIIFGTGPSYEALMKRLALEYPDVRWEVAGLDTSAGNIRAYGARAYEAVYLAGVAAGKMTKTDLIGFVAPVPIPEVVRNIDAFALGAQSVNPTARVKVAWINGWVDPVRETEATQTLINSGADVLISNTASDDPLKQAERVGKFAFGWASDRSEAAPKAHLGSVAFDWGDYYVQSVKQVLAKRWKATPSWQGVKDGRVDLVALSDRLTPDARAAVEEKREALRKGTLQIWKGPLVTVDDRELLPAGKVGDDRFLESLMTYVKGVDGQVPAGR